MNYYLSVLKNYSTFRGRARRAEYWYFTLFNFIFICLAILLDNYLGTTFKLSYGLSMPYGYIYLLYVIFMLIPGLAVTVRRLHDVGKSGWTYFIILIPIIGILWLLVLLFTDSQVGSNKWGENPKLTENSIN
jgi:uncharacterized membrane protein YhaH (DUF805 family)